MTDQIDLHGFFLKLVPCDGLIHLEWARTTSPHPQLDTLTPREARKLARILKRLAKEAEHS